MSDALNTRLGALWLQPDGPNTLSHYLGCHDLGDISVGKGGQELLQCFSRSGEGWDVIGTTEKPPELIKFSIDVPMYKTADWLEKVRCPATLYVTMRDCGRPDVLTNYVRGLALTLSRIASEKYAGLVAREEEKTSMMSFDMEARPPLMKFWKPVSASLTVSETHSFTAITACGTTRCAGDCGKSVDLCEVLYAATKAGGGLAAYVQYSLDGGAIWTPTATAPFAADEDISAIVCVETGRNTSRLIVSRGTTDPASHAEIAYSDDGGDTWHTVDVGTVDGAYMPWHASLFALDWQHVWAVTTDGYVYFSNDAGVTWTAQATAITEDLWTIDFADESYGLAGGVNNSLTETKDGGSTWTVMTGPAAKAGVTITKTQVLDAYNYWITYADGSIYYTYDGGTTWYARTIVGVTLDMVTDLVFVDPQCAWLVVTNTTYLTAAGSILRTFDGGYTWELVEDVDNNGLNAIHACDCNLAFAVGEVYSGNGVIIKVTT